MTSGWASGGGQQKVLYAFCKNLGSWCTDGGEPRGGVLADSAGNLFGTTLTGGAYNGGTVFELVPDADKKKWKHKILHSFCAEGGASCTDGTYPWGDLIADAAGNLYGATEGGGTNDGGIIYRLTHNADRTHWKLALLYEFCSQDDSCADGHQPRAGLTYAGAASGAPYDGSSPVYGTTLKGGTGSGTVFQLKPTGGKRPWKETTLYRFCPTDCSDGANPEAGVILDGSGILYGTTSAGGLNGDGAVFELSPGKTAWTETVLHSFCTPPDCADGKFTLAPLLMDAAGNLLGTTVDGGSHDRGTIFKIVPAGVQSQLTVLYDFCSQSDCLDGARPMAGLIMDSSGNLFGSTSQGGGHDIDGNGVGGGTIFELNASLHVLYSFCAKADCADGSDIQASLIMDASGNLFGAAMSGGLSIGWGTVFEVTP